MDTDKEQLAIQLLAENKSTREVAKATDVSQSTIVRLSENKKEEIKKQTERLIEILPDIIGDIIRDVKTSTTLSKLFAGELEIEEMPLLLGSEPAILTKFMDLSYKMKTDVLKALGVLPSHATSIFIQNLFQSGDNSVISPRILNIIRTQLSSNAETDGNEDDIIDADFEKIEEEKNGEEN